VLVHGEPSATTWWSTSRAARRIRVHRARLGAELRLALREAADPVGDVIGRAPMTVDWIALRAALTRKP
jgi:hypothetical protein